MTEASIASGAVTITKIAVGAVGAAAIASNAVGSAAIASSAVGSTELANGAVTAGKIAAGAIVNADMSATADIADTKLATISTAGKVANSATTATDANTANAIVARDANGGFSAASFTLIQQSIFGFANQLTVNGLDGFVATGLPGNGTIPATGAGSRLMWYPRKSAFRAGSVNGSEWNDASVGEGSVATGYSTTASGSYSTALGDRTTASALNATAMGVGTTASGNQATAMGSFTTASGQGSTAMGGGTTASGQESTAMGRITTASGDYSTAMGHRASTNGMTGAFVYGDNSSFSTVTATANNQFVVRAAGGFNFYTNSGLTAGVTLAAGGSAWAAVSDRRKKEDFRDLDGEAVLEQLARMPIQSWRYRAEPAGIRHAGPVAQDFYAAFRLGDNDTTITTIDADGIALAGVRALERRTAELRTSVKELQALRAEIAALAEENRTLRAERSALEERLARLEEALRLVPAQPAQRP